MTRVIGGQARGRTLVVPKGDTRPTSDRVRESLFASIDASLLRAGRTWDGLAVADVFAGSGALGLEAMSRGASTAVFVERARPAVAALRRNIDTVLGSRASAATVKAVDASAWASTVPAHAFDIVFVDPPYDLPASAVDALVSTLLAADALRTDGLVVVERRNGDPDPLATARTQHGLDVSQRRYGDTLLWYGRRALAEPADASADIGKGA